MKRIKWPMTLAVATLAFGGFVANKVFANKHKKFEATTVYYKVSGTYHTLISAASSSEYKGLTTAINPGQTAKIVTASGTYTLVTGKSTGDKIWYNKP